MRSYTSSGAAAIWMRASPLVAVGIPGSSQRDAGSGRHLPPRFSQGRGSTLASRAGRLDGATMAKEATERLLMVGVSHAEAPLSLLERVVVGRDELADVLIALRAAGFPEAVVLSTCSRSEAYVVSREGGERDLLAMLEDRAGAAAAAVHEAATVRTGALAVRHLFRVTAGFESPVIGEVDIHGQVRTAFRRAQAAGVTGPILGRLFPAALHSSMQVRAQTGLDAHGRSLALQAVEVGLRAAATESRILVVGSGQMATTALEHLSSLGRTCRVTARDETYAARLVGRDLARPLAGLIEEIRASDLLICATSAAQPVVTAHHVRVAMANRPEPLTVVDLAVPRNVDVGVGELDGVRLIDLSGLHDDATEGVVLQACLHIGNHDIDAEVQRFLDTAAAQDAGPIIAALRRQVLDICTERLAGLAGTDASREQLALAAHRIAGKLLHVPILTAREAAAAGDVATLTLLCEMFGLPKGRNATAVTDAPPEVAKMTV